MPASKPPKPPIQVKFEAYDYFERHKPYLYCQGEEKENIEHYVKRVLIPRIDCVVCIRNKETNEVATYDVKVIDYPINYEITKRETEST